MEDCKACQLREETIQELIQEVDRLRKLVNLKSAMTRVLAVRNKRLVEQSDNMFAAMCQSDAISQADGYAGDDECHTIPEKANDSQDGHTSDSPYSTVPPYYGT